MKQSAVEKLLAGVCRVEPILAMSDPWHYRSKVHAVIGTDFKTKQPIAGVYQRGTHRVVPVQGCLIEDPRADRIIRTIVDMIPRYKLRIYNENTHRGFLRHVMVRTGQKTEQIMVILVATASEFPGGKAFVQELVQKHPEITTVVLISTGPSGRFPKVTPPPFIFKMGAFCRILSARSAILAGSAPCKRITLIGHLTMPALTSSKPLKVSCSFTGAVSMAKV